VHLIDARHVSLRAAGRAAARPGRSR
jgi:hypothetical protein